MSSAQTPVDDRDAMLRRGDELWQRLRAALDASMEVPLGPASDWTGHDVYGHFAHWQEHTIDSVRRILAGQRPEHMPGTEDEINDRWRNEDRVLADDVVRKRCIETRRELRALLEELTAEQWERFGRACSVDISGQHYEHHLANVRGESAAQ